MTAKVITAQPAASAAAAEKFHVSSAKATSHARSAAARATSTQIAPPAKAQGKRRMEPKDEYVQAYMRFTEMCERTVSRFKSGSLTTNQFREFLLRNGYTKTQARAEIEQRIVEMNEENACKASDKA